MARLAVAAAVLCLPLALAGCAGGAGGSPPAAASSSTAAPTVFELQRQIKELQTQVDLMRAQIRELQKGQTGNTL